MSVSIISIVGRSICYGELTAALLWARGRENFARKILPTIFKLGLARLMMGISSIVLVEMTMCGIPSASIRMSGTDPNYYCLTVQEFGIARIAIHEALLPWFIRDAERSHPPLTEHHEPAVERITASLLGQSSHRQ